jgi:hypothetical protein
VRSRRRSVGGGTGSPLGQMTTIDVTTKPDGDEAVEACRCCGRPIYEGRGVLESTGGDLADYWYRWSEGHEARFLLAISPCSDLGEPRGGVAVVSGRIDRDNIVYSVVEPVDSPWAGTKLFGPILSREDALNGSLVPDLFQLVDAIAANEQRLSARILECQNVA